MGRELDRRDHTINRATSVREAELGSLASDVSDQLPGTHRVRIRRLDATTGNPAEVTSEHSPVETGNYLQRALNHVHSISRVLGLTSTQPVEFNVDPHIQRTSSGAVAVHMQQHYKGIHVFQAAEAVRFSPDGKLKDTIGSSISVANELSVLPKLSAGEAVLKAAEHIAVPRPDEQGARDEFGESFKLTSVDLTDFEPNLITAYPEKPDQPAVFEGGPFGDKIKASLLWFELDGTLLLTWEVLIAMPDYQGKYRTIVDADNGEIYYCRQLILYIAAQGNVYHVDGDSQRQMTDFPRPLNDYGLPIPGDFPAGFPDDWVAMDNTVGNSTNAHLGVSDAPMDGTSQGGVLTFDPGSSTGDDQKILNIFYYNGVMHDYFYLLGFRENEGNFQRDNFGRGGLGFDRVDARAHSGPVDGTANMGTLIDGLNPVMNMGLVTQTGRHTAFDSSVVYHEFTHGVTNRLVGGSANDWALEALQSGGMGEGWSDYIACTINNTTVVGDWVFNDPGGLRGFPYTSDFPDNFGDLGTGRYTGTTSQGKSWPHPIGEIWCAALLEMNRNIGSNLGVQLVVDALKLSPANPSFLDARNTILSALDDMRNAGTLDPNEYATARRGIWEAFARFGMGPNAQSNGASLSNTVADFNMPTFEESEPEESDIKVKSSPNLTIPDNQDAGVNSVITVAESGAISRLVVSVEIEHSYISDLKVSLTSPLGTSVVLHNRSGGGDDNLVKSYSSDEVSDLQSLFGEESQGDWTLHVVDSAPEDIGTLRQWGLEMDLEQVGQMVHGEASPGQMIPDNDSSGVSSSINIAQSGMVQTLRVSVDITHTYIGDLRVELTAPTGEKALLHNQFGSSEDNLIKTYESISHPGLAALVNQDVKGEWTLKVADLLGQDIGKFNRWSLEIALQ